jgi:hypothetical protein
MVNNDNGVAPQRRCHIEELIVAQPVKKVCYRVQNICISFLYSDYCICQMLTFITLVSQLISTLICHFYEARYKKASAVADCFVLECDTVYSGIQTRCARIP